MFAREKNTLIIESSNCAPTEGAFNSGENGDSTGRLLGRDAPAKEPTAGGDVIGMIARRYRHV